MKKRKIFMYMGYLVLLSVIFINYQLFQGRLPSDVTFDPARKMEKLAGKSNITKGFSNSEFQIYFVDSGEDITPYAFIKRMGVWVRDYPHKKISAASLMANKTFTIMECLHPTAYMILSRDRREKKYAQLKYNWVKKQ